jgi:hypothetical protein
MRKSLLIKKYIPKIDNPIRPNIPVYTLNPIELPSKIAINSPLCKSRRLVHKTSKLIPAKNTIIENALGGFAKNLEPSSKEL